MRKQYYFRPSGNGCFDAWDVDRLVELSKDLRVTQRALSSIPELDTVHWIGADGQPTTVRQFVGHMRLVNEVDPSYPVILGSEGQLMDGMHRVARALLEGRTTVHAVQFESPLEPDYHDVRPEELPH